MSLILIMSSLYLSILFMLLNHPLSFGLMLLIQTCLISFITGLMHYNYWYSYIIFLIIVGSMLILFIYMTSIASNEKFFYSWIPLILLMMTILILPGLLMILDHFMLNLHMKLIELINQFYQINFKLSMNKFLTPNIINNLYLIIIYLLITLIMVVKITNVQYGPLRQKL